MCHKMHTNSTIVELHNNVHACSLNVYQQKLDWKTSPFSKYNKVATEWTVRKQSVKCERFKHSIMHEMKPSKFILKIYRCSIRQYAHGYWHSNRNHTLKGKKGIRKQQLLADIPRNETKLHLNFDNYVVAYFWIYNPLS